MPYSHSHAVKGARPLKAELNAASTTYGSSQGPAPTTGDGSVTVVVGEFGAVLRHGLCQILGHDSSVRVVGVGLREADLERVAADEDPQVAIIDEATVAKPTFVRRLRAARPDLGLVVLAHQPTRAYGVRLLAFGVTACLSKDASGPDILRAIHLAADGKHIFATCGDPSSPVTPCTGAAELTSREKEVLELLSRGQSNAEIALNLHISIETVRTHAAHIYRKLGVVTRGELRGIDLEMRGPSPDS